MATIALDHSLNLAGVSLRFLPIRPATFADYQEAQRARRRKPDEATINLIREVVPHLAPGEKLDDALVSFDLIRRVTGLPFAALVQLEQADQEKIRDFLVETSGK